MFTIIGQKALDEIKEHRIYTRRKMDQIETMQIQDNKDCKARHDLHDEYKELTNKSLNKLADAVMGLDTTIKKVIELTPTMERSKNTFTTVDTLKSWCVYVIAVYAAFEIFLKFAP